MKVNLTVVLLGVVGKKGSGELDNGQKWSTDRVELHCVTEFPQSDDQSFGSTVTCYQVQNYDENFARSRAMIGKEIILDLDIESAKKLGAAPKIICTGFRLAAPVGTLNKTATA